MRFFGDRREGLEKLLGDDTMRLVRYFAESEGIGVVDAVRALVSKGYSYLVMERRFGKEVSSRAAWDLRFRLLRIEAGYAHYRYRLREAVEELRRMTIEMSGLLAQLRLCSRRLKECCGEGLDEGVISEKERMLRAYMKEYIERFREDLDRGEDEYITDSELLDEIEELVKRYRRLFNTS